MAFLDVEFPRGIAKGSQRIAERRVDVVTLGSGYEQTNARWADSRRSWQTGFGIRSADDLAEVYSFFEEAGGPEHFFRFRDWLDYRSCKPSFEPAATDQVIGLGDGEARAFQLVKSYGAIKPYVRPIVLPHAGSVRVAVDGVEVGGGWSVDQITGLVSFSTPPPAGAQITAGFFFDVPVRFASNAIAVEMTYFDDHGGVGVGSVPDVMLVEVRADNWQVLRATDPGAPPDEDRAFSGGFGSGFS